MSGTGFVASSKPTVQLLKYSAIITTTNVKAVNGNKITCTIKVQTDAATGPWNFRVTNADLQSTTKNGAFSANI